MNLHHSQFSTFEILLPLILEIGDAIISSYVSGAEGIRTPDPLLARQVLSQLSYNPMVMSFLYSVWILLIQWA